MAVPQAKACLSRGSAQKASMPASVRKCSRSEGELRTRKKTSPAMSSACAARMAAWAGRKSGGISLTARLEHSVVVRDAVHEQAVHQVHHIATKLLVLVVDNRGVRRRHGLQQDQFTPGQGLRLKGAQRPQPVLTDVEGGCGVDPNPRGQGDLPR